MYDRFNRKINYLRVSVTDRCNLRCTYCMPSEGVQLMGHDDILRFDEIVEVVREAVNMGVDKVRITGGEPLVRKGIVDLVKLIGEIEGVKDFAMTTNGILLPKYAHHLVEAGLQRVNISLDTLDPEKYEKITRVGRLKDVLEGIEAAKEAGLSPIKINCVIQESEEEPDAREVATYCEQNGLKIRYIREMDLEKGQFWKVKGGEGGACNICNRLRLTSDGKIKPCLFSDIEYDIREFGAKGALEKALGSKPKSGTTSLKNKFSKVGG
jgi:GTP 3',8-cyclase